MPSPTLWQNSEQSITLIDIPHFISAAQGENFSSSHQLLSRSPLQSPFTSNEPKSASAKAKLTSTAVDDILHVEYQQLLQEAIEEVKTNHTGSWCLPRTFVEDSPREAKKRRLQDSDAISSSTDKATLPDYFLSNIARGEIGVNALVEVPPSLTTNNCNETETESVRTNDVEGLSVFNVHSRTATLRVNTDNGSNAYTFHVPPNACFYIGDCTNSKPFRDAVRKQARQTGDRSTFDSILLDPPWPNRSVKRTHKTAGSTYATSPSLDDIRDLLLDTHLDTLMADRCLVGIWTTNKSSIRDLVLGENGIFDCWNIDLVEEWVWLKTTVCGVPVTRLDGVWRKPYEVLLIGRRRAIEGVSTNTPALSNIKRRVIIGVPDLHSRKPCLKFLIEPMMNDPKNYRALEVFARHLVAGWWSWGDECIKFNWDGYWRQNADE